MGFRSGTFCKVWEVTPISDSLTKLRLSSSRKNSKTQEYETDFSGYVACVGTAAASSAAKLKKDSRIKIGDCDVTTVYDKEKKVTYTNFKIFSFENADGGAPKQEVAEGEDPFTDAEFDEDGRKFPY